MIKTASLLVYDIPTDSDYPNPSYLLRRTGFRINLSCWVIPKERIPWHLLNEFSEARIRWHIVDFACEESEKLVEMAASSLRAEIAETVKNAREAEIRARTRADGTEIESKKKYWSRVRSALSTAKKLIKDAKSACAAFGLDALTFSFGEAQGAIQNLHISAKTKAYTYARTAKHLEALGGIQATAMASMLRNNEIGGAGPALVAADMLEENGSTDAAESIRHAFAGDM